MCMKNININVVLCDVIPNQDKTSISLGDIVSKKFHITVDENYRRLSQLSMAIFISATQTKDEDKIRLIDPDTTISFDHTYEVRVRLSEISTNSYMDLDHFIFEPSKLKRPCALDVDAVGYAKVLIRNDIVLPKENNEERFVIKILIRKQETERSFDSGWIVQTIQPIEFDN